MDQIVGACQIPWTSSRKVFLHAVGIQRVSGPVPVEDDSADRSKASTQLAELALVVADVGGPVEAVGWMGPIHQRVVKMKAEIPLPQRRGQFRQDIPFE